MSLPSRGRTTPKHSMLTWTPRLRGPPHQPFRRENRLMSLTLTFHSDSVRNASMTLKRPTTFGN
eukprot:2549535-Prymnesium_polylepis.1